MREIDTIENIMSDDYEYMDDDFTDWNEDLEGDEYDDYLIGRADVTQESGPENEQVRREA